MRSHRVHDVVDVRWPVTRAEIDSRLVRRKRSQRPFWVMKDAGFFEKEGSDANLVYIPSSWTIAQAQISGDVHVSTANSQVIIDADLRGGDLIAVGAVTDAVAFYVMADPRITTVSDLKGEKVGVTRFGASTDFAMRKLLGKYGLKPVSDVPIVQIGGMPEIAAALSHGAIAAAPMSYPMAYVAQKKWHATSGQYGQRGHCLRTRRHHNLAGVFTRSPEPGQSACARIRQSCAIHAHQQGRFKDNHQPLLETHRSGHARWQRAVRL